MSTLDWMTGSLIQWALSIAIALPFWALAAVIETANAGPMRRRRTAAWYRGGRLALFFLVSLALARMPAAWTPIPFPWQAMVLEAAWALVFLALFDRAGHTDSSGLTLRINRTAWRDSLLVTGALIVFVVLRSVAIRWLGLGGENGGGIGWEYLLYQMTMPGIAEELSYRGVIQSGLNAVFPRSRKWRVGGTHLGWGWLIASILFWAPHAIRVGSAGQVVFYWPTLTMQLVVGGALGWMRERTGSIFPGIIAHNLVNVAWMML